MMSLIVAALLSAAPTTTEPNICKVDVLNRFSKCLSTAAQFMDKDEPRFIEEMNYCEDSRIRNESSCRLKSLKERMALK